MKSSLIEVCANSNQTEDDVGYGWFLLQVHPIIDRTVEWTHTSCDNVGDYKTYEQFSESVRSSVKLTLEKIITNPNSIVDHLISELIL